MKQRRSKQNIFKMKAFILISLVVCIISFSCVETQVYFPNAVSGSNVNRANRRRVVTSASNSVPGQQQTQRVIRQQPQPQIVSRQKNSRPVRQPQAQQVQQHQAQHHQQQQQQQAHRPQQQGGQHRQPQGQQQQPHRPQQQSHNQQQQQHQQRPQQQQQQQHQRPQQQQQQQHQRPQQQQQHQQNVAHRRPGNANAGNVAVATASVGADGSAVSFVSSSSSSSSSSNGFTSASSSSFGNVDDGFNAGFGNNNPAWNNFRGSGGWAGGSNNFNNNFNNAGNNFGQFNNNGFSNNNGFNNHAGGRGGNRHSDRSHWWHSPRRPHTNRYRDFTQIFNDIDRKADPDYNSSEEDDDTNEDFNGRSVVAPGQYPHMAAVGFRKTDGGTEFKCGGSLISEMFVLTAAHCCDLNGEAPHLVKIGDIKLKEFERDLMPQRRGIASILVHPFYNATLNYNDIGLLELTNPIEYSHFVRPIRLWARDEIPYDKVFTMGYGSTSFAQAPTNVLTELSLSIVPQEKCNSTLPEDENSPYGIVESQICAKDFEQNRDTCQGDSGGPLQLNLERRRKRRLRYYLVGIISYGTFCRSQYPGVYTRVSSYVDWIASIVWPEYWNELQQETNHNLNRNLNLSGSEESGIPNVSTPPVEKEDKLVFS